MRTQTCIFKGKKKKCYKFGVTDNIKTRLPPYKTGNPTFKLLYYIPLNIDMNQLETCIISIMLPHEVKKNNETVSFVSLLANIIIKKYKYKTTSI